VKRFNTIFRTVCILAALLALSLIAIQPFSRGNMLLTDDGTLHLYRIIALDHSMRYDGSLYPRFSSALAYGYGAPLFNYFSPFAYYLPRTLHGMGFSFVHAYLAAMTLYLWLAMLGAYLLGRRIAGEAGGLIAAVAYLYAPYLLYNAVSRGTITEVAALALLPWVIWAVTRLRDHPSLGSVLIAIVAYALFIPMHNIVTLHGSLLLAMYGLLLIGQSRIRLHTTLALGVVAVMSLALTAFFWLPALAETELIKLPLITAQLPMLDVTQHLRPLSSVLALPSAVDPQQQQAPIPITVSWVALVAGAAGLLVAFYKRTLRSITLFWMGVLVFCLFMNTEASTFLWRSLPLFHYTQFAWRILGIASLSLAILASIGVSLVLSYSSRDGVRSACMALVCGGLILYSIPFTYRPSLFIQAQTIHDAQHYERERGEAALSSYSEYLPVHADIDTMRDSLRPLWEEATVINRWSDNNTGQLLESVWRGTSARLRVSTGIRTSVHINWLYMPHWRVTLDDVALPVYPGPNGLLAFDIPAGEHRIEIRYGLSSIQTAAVGISGIALLLTTGMILHYFARRQTHLEPSASLSVRPYLIAASAGFILVAIKTSLIDTTDNLFHRSLWRNDFFTGEPVVDISFAREVTLLHATLSYRQETHTIEMVTSWTRDEALRQNLGIVYTLENTDGFEVARISDYQIADVDTLRWISGLYLQDRQQLALPTGILPGRYEMFVSVYADGHLLSPVNSQDQPLWPEILVGAIEIPWVQSFVTPAPDVWTVQSHSSLPLQALEGEAVVLGLNWVAGKDHRITFQLLLHWKLNGQIQLTSTVPTQLYEDIKQRSLPGQKWQTYSRIFIPPFGQSGMYELLLEKIHENDDSALVPLGSIQVVSPERLTTMSGMQNRSDIRWVNGIQMRAYSLTTQEFTMTWQVSKPVIEHLHLFVHVLDENGIILYQYDEVPCAWTRPVAGWVVEEYIQCSYALEPTLPYSRIRTGFYHPDTGERVLLTDGSDSALIMVANGN